jgi:hypothetical protein
MKRSLQPHEPLSGWISKRPKWLPGTIVPQLPDDIISILLGLSDFDDIKNWRSVNKKWKWLISLTKSVMVIPNESSFKAMTIFPKAKSVVIFGEQIESDILIDWHSVTKLRLVDLIPRIQTVHAFDSLEEFTWETDIRRENCIAHVLRHLASIKTLKKLTIINKKGYDDQCLLYYGALENLEELNMIDCTDFSYSFLQMIANLPNLKRLNLTNTEFDEIFPLNWYKTLSFPKLKSLDISKTVFTVYQFASLRVWSIDQIIKGVEVVGVPICK